MKRFRYITYAVLVGATLLALVPIGQRADDWADGGYTPRTTDGVRWAEQGDTLVATYVPPGSPAAQAGLRAGDRLYMFGYRPYRDLASFREAVASVPPGEERAYHVARDGGFERLSVTLTARPAFLYPLSPGLWNFSLWGFAFAGFFHLLGLIVVGPTVRRSRHALFSLALVIASSAWVFATLARFLIVETTGLPGPEAALRPAFDALAGIGAAGWGLFPALLLHKVTNDTQRAAGQAPTPLRFAVYAPPAALTFLLFAGDGAFRAGRLAALTTPMLLYLCCFIAASAGVVLTYLRRAPDAAPPGPWGDTGGAFLLVAAGVAGVLVLLFVPFSTPVTTPGVGALVVAVGLLSTVPVVLVALATLRHVAPGGLLARALVYAAVLGSTFFAFVGGYTVIRSYLGTQSGLVHNVAVGLFAVALLLVFERVARRGRFYAGRLFDTGAQRARQSLSRFQEQMRTILTHEALAQQTASVVGAAFSARSVRLFLRAGPGEDAAAPDGNAPDGNAPDGNALDGNALDGKGDEPLTRVIAGAHHPQPPYFTEQHFAQVWPYMQRESRVWARNPELRESTLPEKRAQMLDERGVALALPIMGEGAPIGLLALGGKQKRGELYDHDDLDLLRFLGGQLALAVERLDLVARERTLVRASARAELAALRAQINPHFLFNALNTIASLIEGRPDEAEDTVEHLATIFRHILQTGSQSFVPLKKEFTLVQHYLQIEQMRFGDALDVAVDLPPALATHDVPAFAVQTLVENAVKHGIARQRDGGTVRVAAQRVRPAGDAPAVEVIVDDTGAGISALFSSEDAPRGDGAPTSPGERTRRGRRTGSDHGSDASARDPSPHPSFYGVGLRNVADRLERLYDRTDLLTFQSAPGEGTTARLHAPPAPSNEEEDASAAGTPPEAMRRV